MRPTVRRKVPLVLAAFLLVTLAVLVAVAGLGSHSGSSEAAAAPGRAELVPPTPDWSSGSAPLMAEAPAIDPVVPSPPPPQVRTLETRAVLRIAGLTQEQADNAQLIVDAARQRGLPRRAQVIAMVTVLQESNLRNLANPTVPESLRYRHQGAESDFDSVGLFQQRPSQGWGSVGQLMDPTFASSAFYSRLVGIPGWQNMAVAAAAQAVQRSSFPTAYAKHETRAAEIVSKII